MRRKGRYEKPLPGCLAVEMKKGERPRMMVEMKDGSVLKREEKRRKRTEREREKMRELRRKTEVIEE